MGLATSSIYKYVRTSNGWRYCRPCGPQKRGSRVRPHPSRRDPLQHVFMMKASQNRPDHNLVIFRDVVT